MHWCSRNQHDPKNDWREAVVDNNSLLLGNIWTLPNGEVCKTAFGPPHIIPKIRTVTIDVLVIRHNDEHFSSCRPNAYNKTTATTTIWLNHQPNIAAYPISDTTAWHSSKLPFTLHQTETGCLNTHFEVAST